MSQESEKQENVVNLAEARRRQKTVRAGGSGKDKQDKGHKTPTGLRKVLVYVQFVVFLAIVAYMIQLCSGRH